MERTDLLAPDLQSAEPEVRIGLSRAGVHGVSKAIRLRRGRHEKLVSAEISCFVDLDPAQRGVHMSRFPELFGEAIDEVVIGEAFLVETLAEHIARHIVERQDALRAEVRIEAQYPLARRTPVTGLATQEIATLIGIASASTYSACPITTSSIASPKSSGNRDMCTPFCAGSRSTVHAISAANVCSCPACSMRIAFETPVTPTRCRPSWISGREAWRSTVRSRRSVAIGYEP